MYTHTYTQTQEWLEFWKTWGRTSHGVINMKFLTLRLLDLGQILARWDSGGLKSPAHPNSLVLLRMLPETSGKSSFFLRIFFFFFRIQFQFRCELLRGPEHYRSLSLTHTFEWRNWESDYKRKKVWLINTIAIGTCWVTEKTLHFGQKWKGGERQGLREGKHPVVQCTLESQNSDSRCVVCACVYRKGSRVCKQVDMAESTWVGLKCQRMFSRQVVEADKPDWEMRKRLSGWESLNWALKNEQTFNRREWRWEGM